MSTYTLTGRITNLQAEPLQGLMVRAFNQPAQAPVILVGKDMLTDSEGKYNIVFELENRQTDGRPNTDSDVFIRVYDGRKLLGESAVQHNTKPRITIDLQVDNSSYEVSGRVYTSKRIAAPNVEILLLDKRVGGEVVLGRTRTDARGQYHMEFKSQNAPKDRPDLQIAAVDAVDIKKVLGRSSVHYDAPSEQTINLILEADHDPLPVNEFNLLNTTLTKHLNGAGLKDLQENETREDISYLARKTGIDARMVAMSALAHSYGDKNKLPPDVYYALFRAGISTNEADLNRTNPATVLKALKRAIQANIISGNHQKSIPQYLESLGRISITHALNTTGRSGVSTMGGMLELVLKTEVQRQEFAKAYSEQQGNMEPFWQQITKSFGDAAAKQLQLDGKLGLLTVNNAPLISKLRNLGQVQADPVELVRNGFYKTEAWNSVLTKDIVLPPHIAGNTAVGKRQNYAGLMAAELRLSYPTAVLAHQIEKDEIIISDNPATKSVLTGFLNTHQGKFEIGKTPVAGYVKNNQIQLHADPAINEQVLSSLKRLERVYQISPSDEAMSVLLANKLDSAFAVARNYDEKIFVRKFSRSMGGEHVARLVFAKSSQVASAVMNLVMAYNGARSYSGIYAISPSHPLHKNGPDNSPASHDDVIANPTLEALFGEMDYCTCEHCRSVLSPAAYLVDLLKYIDRTENLGGKSNPVDVLLDRRPDIEHLQLTCENTNTILPYIDLVNEILEHFVVHHNLTTFQGFNISEEENSADLLANPQFINDAAYQTLFTQVYPVNLPFNQPLASLRAYFEHLKLPLWQAMKLLRTNDDLLTTGGSNASPYGWQEIYTESLGISPQQYKIFVDNEHQLPVYYGEAANADLNTILSAESDYARKLTRKLDITYKELVAIVKTQFINPHAHLITRLEKLQVALPTLIAYINSNGAIDFDLPEGIDASKYDGDVKAWLLKKDGTRNIDNPASIKGLILLTDPTGSNDDCNFVPLQLRYADQSLLRQIDYWKLLRFVRIWRALGWSIEQTDLSVKALYPVLQFPLPGDTTAQGIIKLNRGFTALITRLAQLKQVMMLLKMNPKKDLAKVVSFWSDIGIYGPGSHYRRLFLNPTIAKMDDVFQEDGYGQYLQNAGERLSNHTPALLAAFNTTEESLDLIHAHLGLTDALTLSNISSLYRYTVLSRALRISIQELLILKKLSGADPFGILGVVPQETIRFIEVVNQVKTAGFKLTNLNYFLLNEDISGKASPTEQDVLAFMRGVRSTLAAVDQDNPNDMEDPDGELARAKLALVYGQEAADVFFGLIDRAASFSVDYDHATEVLEPSIRAVSSRMVYNDTENLLSFEVAMTEQEKGNYLELPGVSQAFKDAVDQLYAAQGPAATRYDHGVPALESSILAVSSRVGYDDFAKRLSFQGVLSEQERATFAALGVSAAFETAINKLSEQSRALFEKYHALGDLYESKFATLTAPARKAAYGQILSWLMPVLKPQLKRLALREYLRASLSVEADILIAFLETPSVLHAANGEDALYIDFTIAEAGAGFTEDQPAAGQRRLRVYVEAPANGFFNWYIETNAATLAVHIGGQVVTGTLSNHVWTNDSVVWLKAGELTFVEIIATGATVAPLVKWSGSTMAKSIINANQLYSFEVAQTFRKAYLRLLKSQALADGLSFGMEEIVYFSQFPKLVGGNPVQVNWLNAILAPDQDTPATPSDVFRHFETLINYTALRKALKIKGNEFISILKDPSKTNEKNENLLLKITGWLAADRDALLLRMGLTVADLSGIRHLDRMMAAFNALVQTGLSAPSLLLSTTVAPVAQTVRDFQAALRARYDEISWREVIQPINDGLRNQRRDALVSYTLHRLSQNPATVHIDTSEKLFEFFLIDVEMDACMKTSRIKQAISSVQLFIHRCLLNLENNVSPGAINARQWDWMKRYRVWEANRKVFLWPENWLEPELRDDKSSFFRELESELLQSDITEDTAAVALLNYLSKLDTVAKLEICGLYVQENDIRKQGEYYAADDIIHVIGRTPGVNRKYYYRRYEYGYWTPWEKIDLDIEDNPVMPVVWKNRLLLFWLNIITKGKANTNPPITQGEDNDMVLNAQITAPPPDPNKGELEITLTWSEYYNGKWQPRQTSDMLEPAKDEYTNNRNGIRLTNFEGPEGELVVRVEGETFSFYNKHSIPQKGSESELPMPKGIYKHASVGEDPTEAFSISYRYNNTVSSNSYPWETGMNHEILSGMPVKTVLPNQTYKGNSWEMPFFLQNARHVFFVEREEKVYRTRYYNHYGVLKPIVQDIQNLNIIQAWNQPDKNVSGIDALVDPLIKTKSTQIPGSLPRITGIIERFSGSKIIQGLVNEQPVLFNGVPIGALGRLNSQSL